MNNNKHLTDYVIPVMVLLFAVPATPVPADTLTVCPSGCQYSSINTAILNANLGDKVLVDDGTYNEHIGFPAGFSGITVESVNGPESTIIDFNQLTPINGGHVVGMGCGCGNCDTCPTVLDGFTIKGGNSKSSAGGIDIMGGEIRNCIVKGNEGKVGGGIRVLGGAQKTTIFNTIVEDNFAETGGGIAFLSGNPAFIEFGTIRNNYSTLGKGGGISVAQREITISHDSEISGNFSTHLSAEALGGGIYMSGAAVTLRASVVSDNEANSDFNGKGGGIYLSGTLYLEHASIRDNNRAISSVGSGWGGGIYCTGLINNTFSQVWGNNATTEGDDVYFAPSTACASEIETESQQNYESSGTDGDPVNTFTGELYTSGSVDLSLGGPMPLFFARRYASGLISAGIGGRLGDNWLHNFEWSMSGDASMVMITTNRGRKIHFAKPAADWVLSLQTDIAYQLIESGPDFILGDPRTARMYTFDAAGKLTKVEDGKGNVHTLIYTGDDLTTVSDGLGRTLILTYGVDTYLDTVSDGTRTITFSHAGDNLASITDARGNTTTYAYAAGGLMTGMTRPEGNTPFTQTYDAEGRVATQTDAGSNTHTFTYDITNDQTTTMTNPLSDTKIHTHNPRGELAVFTDENGTSSGMGYDVDGRKNSITDRFGDATSYTYHAPSGEVASITNPDMTVTTFDYTARVIDGLTFYDLTGVTYPDATNETLAYDAQGNVIAQTDQNGDVSTFTYNGNGQILTATNPAGGVVTNVYNADGTLDTRTDPSNNTTSFGYDGLGRLVTINHPDASTRTYTYDENDNVLTVTDERNNTTAFAYDKNNNLQTVTDALSNTTSFAYDDLDRLITVTEPLLSVVGSAYDELGRLQSLTDPNGNTTIFGYDARGRLISMTDGDAKVWALGYDVENVLASFADPLSHVYSISSNNMGRWTDSTSPIGNLSAFDYDSMGRLINWRNPLGEDTSIGYDNGGQIVTWTLENGIAAGYVRNSLGQITIATDPNGQAWQRAFDAHGRMTSSTDPLGATTAYSYDNRNRISLVDFPASDLALTHDDAGNVTRELYSDGTDLNFSYDALNRLTAAEGISLSYDDNGWTNESNGMAITTDPGGRIATLTLAPGKVVTYGYNGRNLLTEVSDWLGGTTFFSYDDAGRMTSITRPNGVTTTYAYDDEGWVIGITEGSISNITLTRDAGARITTAARDIPSPASPAQSATINLAYDAASQIDSYAYDALGRLTSDGYRDYTWDLASRLSGYADASNNVAFAYDALGNRISRTASGVTHEYVWNYALQLPSISVRKVAAIDSRYYVHAPDGRLLYTIEAADNSRRDYHFDEMGNTLFLTDSAGAVIASYAYGPYGETLRNFGAVDNAFTWQGQSGVMRDGASSLYYMRARYYDGATGRFISRDPVRTIEPHSINPYQYALANPLLNVDPFGLHSHRFKAGADILIGDIDLPPPIPGKQANAFNVLVYYKDGIRWMKPEVLGYANDMISRTLFGFSEAAIVAEEEDRRENEARRRRLETLRKQAEQREELRIKYETYRPPGSERVTAEKERERRRALADCWSPDDGGAFTPQLRSLDYLYTSDNNPVWYAGGTTECAGETCALTVNPSTSCPNDLEVRDSGVEPGDFAGLQLSSGPLGVADWRK